MSPLRGYLSWGNGSSYKHFVPNGTFSAKASAHRQEVIKRSSLVALPPHGPDAQFAIEGYHLLTMSVRLPLLQSLDHAMVGKSTGLTANSYGNRRAKLGQNLTKTLTHCVTYRYVNLLAKRQSACSGGAMVVFRYPPPLPIFRENQSISLITGGLTR
jgi:hypothetical protein